MIELNKQEKDELEVTGTETTYEMNFAVFKIKRTIKKSCKIREMGDYLLLKGQRVIPKRLIEEGYQFAYPQCANALKQEFQ